MGDSGYTGVHKREENLGLAVDWQVAMKPGQRRKLAPGNPAALREKAKASIQAKSLPPSPIGGGTPLSGRKEAIRLRQEPALAKAGVRYRGLAKNRERMALLLGLSILKRAQTLPAG